MEQTLAEKHFDEQVIKVLEKRVDGEYIPLQYENQATILIKNEPFVAVYMKYVNEGEQTSDETLTQSILGEKGESRVSAGEWVIEKIYQINENAHRLVSYGIRHMIDIVMSRQIKEFRNKQDEEKRGI